MTLSDLGNLGEFISAFAVVLSLLYLAIQIRHNTRQVRASAFQEVTRGWQEFLYAMSSDDRMAIWAKGLVDPNTLNQEEAMKNHALVRAYLRGIENDYYQYRQGTFDATAWKGYLNSFRKDGLSHSGFRASWESQREHFGSGFAALVDRELESLTVNKLPDVVDVALDLGRTE